MLSQIAEEESWPVAMWRSLNLHQERTVPQICSDWLSPPGGCSPGHTGWCSYRYPFCLHPRQQQPYYQRSVTSDQKHQRTDTYLGWLQWTQLSVGQSWYWHPGWSHWEIHRQTQSVCSQWRNPHLSETPSPACEQTNISDRPHHLHTRTCSEKCVGGAARYPWQWSLSHTNFNPTISSRDTTELWSFTLGVFQGRLGTVSRSMLGRHHWGHPRGSRLFTLLCWDHNQGCKWRHPKGNHDSQKIEPLVWWRMPEALKARRVLDKRFWQSRELRGETLSAFRRSQAKARHLLNQTKRQSWTEYVSKLSTDTPIKHVWDRVRKISGKNVCAPKQYLNGKNGTAITNPKDIANEHAAVFTDNSSSAHYSATFQTIKEQEEMVKIDFTSNNTEVYNKPFVLRDLRRSIMKAKPRAPGPDGIHNNLLKHLPEDALQILREILNRIWTSADFPQQWRAATVIPIPTPNKDHTDLLSYRPIALTSCLC